MSSPSIGKPAAPDTTIARQRLPTAAEKVGLALMTCPLGVLLAGYGLILVERKRKVFFGRGPFLVEHALDWWEKFLYLLLFCGEIVALVLTASLLLQQVLRPILRCYRWPRKAIVLSVGSAYFLIVTAQYQVVQYFRDGVNLALVRRLAGGSARDALTYIQNEVAGLADVVVLWLILVIAGGWAARRYSHSLSERLRRTRLVGALSSSRGVLALNAALLIAPLLIVAASPALHDALNYSAAHVIYSFAAAQLTDIDGDGYGWMSRPVDFAPFDAQRHPYALEVPGNSVDENGIGGDLPRVLWNRTQQPWNAEKLHRKNILLVVMDSARYDLLDWKVQGEPVMPTLRGSGGQRLSLFTHAAYTTPSVIGMFTGTISQQEAGISLIDRFKALGYATGIFSAQHEGFGGISAATRMLSVDEFVDGTAFPIQQRMYSNTAPGALSIPAALVGARFAKWLAAIDGRPFFAYVNWQEMHFPYYYPGSPLRLLDRPIPRGRIVPEHREWVRRTYANAARVVDEAFSDILRALDRTGVREETVIVVVGDHGEELFENGYLGHGTSVSYEQNATLGMVIHAGLAPPPGPVGLNDLEVVVHNALVKGPSDALPMADEVLSYVGNVRTPQQIGLFSRSGLVKYDFRGGGWSAQRRAGAPMEPAPANRRVIHVWESFLVQRLRPEKRRGS